MPGKPDESLLWQKLARDEMPKTDNKVSDANKKLIREWIASGAKGAEKSSGATVTRAAKKPAEVAKHIDKEIDSRLSAAKVPASPKADDAEFLRRAYLDIVGKPPTAQQAATFLDSADADKRAKLIDSLLASEDCGKHFGERWVNVFYLTTVNQRPLPPEPFKEWFAKRLNDGRGWDADATRSPATSSPPPARSPRHRRSCSCITTAT